MTLWFTPSLATILSIVALTSAQEQITECTYDADSCGCKTDQGYINLRSYEDKPLYAKDPIQDNEYHWNPCKDFQMGTINSACIQHLPAGDDYDCGSHDTTKTSVEEGNAVFQLVSGDLARLSKITCICKKNAVDVFSFEGEFPPGTYDMQLSGDSCCPGAAPPSSDSSGDDLSPGSILLIIFLVAVVLYLIVGVVVQTAIRKARGKESLPNVIFWSALPGLIKDGFLFTFSCGKQTGYNKI
ncbi:hypothetical protein RRG08_056698 [Elysia crispata]|uniref:Cation-dependent mannose-6-phosphate receptor n=1 Tax=Elysia crispata TaxID=231223 RepID=A0AAE1AXJ0_9GAST|nr:hypothetical protein RRG08_056698 [Elysia crispata]